MKLQTKHHSFYWNADKERLNLRKHGVTFDTAATVREEPDRRLAVRIISARPATSRERFNYENGGLMVREDPDMLDDYTTANIDWSKAERGKYYVEGQVLHIPVYLDPPIMRYFMKAAHQQGCQTRDLLNEILTKEMNQREAARDT